MCNIYHQQHQTALFLREYYTGQKVIISDVGAPTFFADIDIIDVIGLGTDEILPELLKKRKYEYIAEQVDAKIAILLQRGAGKLVRDAGFIKVAKCTIKNNVVCANDKTYYIARNEASAKQLADNIREFSASMPKDVTVELFYDSSAGPE